MKNKINERNQQQIRECRIDKQTGYKVMESTQAE